jgi:hypothetical protein
VVASPLSVSEFSVATQLEVFELWVLSLAPSKDSQAIQTELTRSFG